MQTPHPPLIMGGNAGPRAARLAARYADEYNTVMPTLDEIRERKANIDAACAKAGREPIPFTIMTAASVGKDHPDASETWIAGSVDQVKERLAPARGRRRLRRLPPAAGPPRHRDGRASIGRELT